MKAVFADTFYYFALLNPNDSAHKAAVNATRQLNSTTVTTGWVLLELATGSVEAFLVVFCAPPVI